jgi:hypothetical protein
MGETRVDLLHLLEDLRDAYTGPLEETVLTEIVANSLDSGATRIELVADSKLSTLTVRDDGTGMQRRDLARFHDIAASSKTRGEGIGFAGVGIKLGLLLCEEVITETRRGKSHVASRWHLASKHRAPWNWIPAPGRVTERGTAVALTLRNPLSPLLDAGFIEATLRRHFMSLFDPAFDDILSGQYPQPPAFQVNGELLERGAPAVAEVAPIEVKLGRKRKPAAYGYLSLSALPLLEDARGVSISTLGKVIRRGWEWLGVTPSAPDRIGGVIEVPALAECLTLNKADFVRTGPRGATYLSYRKALQEVVSRQLALWGAERDAGDTRRRAARPVERDLERVLVELADDFPLLASLVERREGGQRRLPFGSGALAEDGRSAVAAALFSEREANADAGTGVENGQAAPGESEAPATSKDAGDTPLTESDATAAESSSPSPLENTATLPSARGSRKPGRYGLAIQFETRAGEPDLARLVESTVWVNDAHPAFIRAAASRSEGYHLALSVAMALAPLAVEARDERAFVTRFLERWGDALAAPGRKGRG